MAFGKKGWRKIVVEGQIFYWTLAFRGFWDELAEKSSMNRSQLPTLNIAEIRPERDSHRLLVVYCGNEVLGFANTQVVTPKVVRKWIETACAHGWPKKCNSFELNGLDTSGVPYAGTPRK